MTKIVTKVDFCNHRGQPFPNAGGLTSDEKLENHWQMGRQLQGISGTGLTTSYKYNENGLRTERTVNGMTHEYTLLGSSVTREVIKDATGNILWTIHYSYAGDSTPVSMNVNGTEYYYLKNAQGDITHIVDGDGNEVASYEYDAWGKHLKVTGGEIAELNPYRYRGYRYDSETGLYYLQSRYYNPEWGRLINADEIVGIMNAVGSYNIYSYCENSPITRTDSTGYWALIDDLIAGFVGGVVGGVSQLASDLVTSAVCGSWQFSSWETYAGAFTGGAVGGVVTLYAGPVAGAGLGSGASTFIGQSLENITGREKRSLAEIGINTFIDGTIGAVLTKALPISEPGITSGRNSMSAVFKSGLTKLANGTARRMSAKVIAKGIVSGIMSDMGRAFFMGFKHSWHWLN